MGERLEADAILNADVVSIIIAVSDDRGIVSKRQRMIDEMMGCARLVTERVDMKEKGHRVEPIDMTEPAASLGLCPQGAEAMRMVLGAMYPIRSLHSVDFRELVNEHRLTHRDFCWTL